MQDLVLLGAGIAAVGFLVIFLATVLGAGSEGGRGGKDVEVRGGGVITIGPIPIIFGTDPKWAVIAIVLAIVLIALAFLLVQSL